MSNLNKEIGWDAKVETDGGFELIPEGTYNFKAVNMTQGRFIPSATSKIKSECNMATVTLKIDVNGEPRQMDNSLILYSTTMGFVGQFFGSIGMKKKNVDLVLTQQHWQNIIGSTGQVKVSIKKSEQYGDQNQLSFIHTDDAKPLGTAEQDTAPATKGW